MQFVFLETFPETLCRWLTLNHEELDREVVDMGCVTITGINAHAFTKLRKAFGLEGSTIKINGPLQLL